eukprot:gene3533-2484_t
MKPSSTLNPLQGYTSNGKLTLSPCYSNTHYPHNKQSIYTTQRYHSSAKPTNQTQNSLQTTNLLTKYTTTHNPNQLIPYPTPESKSSPLEHYSRFPYQTYHISIYKLDTQPTPLKMLTNRKPQNITVATPNRASQNPTPCCATCTISDTLQTTNPQPIRNHKPPVTACITIPTHPSQVSASHQIPANQFTTHLHQNLNTHIKIPKTIPTAPKLCTTANTNSTGLPDNSMAYHTHVTHLTTTPYRKPLQPLKPIYPRANHKPRHSHPKFSGN